MAVSVFHPHRTPKGTKGKRKEERLNVRREQDKQTPVDILMNRLAQLFRL
jgi:hypothetical protein